MTRNGHPAPEPAPALLNTRSSSWGEILTFTIASIFMAAPLAAAWRLVIELAKWGWSWWPG